MPYLIAVMESHTGHGHVYMRPHSGSSDGIKFCTILSQHSLQSKSIGLFCLSLVVPGRCLDYAVEIYRQFNAS